MLDQKVATDVDADSDTKEIAGLFIDRRHRPPRARRPTSWRRHRRRACEAPRRAAHGRRAEARRLAKVEKGVYSGMTSPLGRAIVLAIGFAQHDDPEYYREDVDRYLPRHARRPGPRGREVSHARAARPADPARQGSSRRPSCRPVRRRTVARPVDAVARTPEGGPDWSKLPGPSEPRPFQPPKVARQRLSNGIDLWVAEWHTLPIVRSDCSWSPPARPTIPKGSRAWRRSTASLARQGDEVEDRHRAGRGVRALGASLGVRSGLEETGLGFSTLVRNLDPALTLVGEVLTEPAA